MQIREHLSDEGEETLKLKSLLQEIPYHLYVFFMTSYYTLSYGRLIRMSNHLEGWKFMDILQLQVLIEKTLNAIFSQGSDAIEYLKLVLSFIANWADGIGVFFAIAAGLAKVASQLLELINSGAGITEIVAALVQLIISGTVTIDAVIKLLQILSEIVLAF